jgi:type I restriction enzyme S subunit
LAEQRQIARVLSSLDDAIDLNHRMNETLEATARAIFKSWFVDFDPVCHIADRLPSAQTLFPSSLEDSEIGLIPAGWSVGNLQQLVMTAIGGDWGNAEPDADNDVACYCIRGTDIPSLQRGSLGNTPVRHLDSRSVSKRRLKDGDLVIEISGGSPTQSTGRTVLATEALLREADMPVVASNFCRILRLQSRQVSKYVYLWLRTLYDAGELFQFENGTTGIKNLAFTLFCERYPVLIPPGPVLARFDELLTPMFDRMHVAAHQSRVLAEMRDSLLPKLIGGEISIRGAETLISSV